jgi:hypothetical protein
MVWGKAGTTTLTSAGNDMNITMTSNKFSQVLSHHSAESGAIGNWTTFNDTGSVTQTDKYVRRQSIDGGTDSASYGSEDASPWQYGGTKDEFVIADVFATSGEEILFITHVINAGNTGVSTGATPHRNQLVGKSTISAPVTRIDFASGSNNFGVSSNLSVLGSDIAGSAAVPAIPALVKSLQSPSVGGWKEIARTTLGSAGDTISVTDLANKRYYMVLTDAIAVGNLYPELELNGDATSGNYRYRRAINGGTDSTGGYVALFPTNTPVATTETYFAVSYLSNLSTKEKIGMSNDVFSEASAATNAPSRQRHVSKWTNTSDAINRIDRSEDGSGTYNTNSEVVVLGWDPADTHTTNFWEELASVELDSGNVRLSSGTITAKKYLWFQYYIKGTSSCRQKIQFNGSTATDYAFRYSANGGADSGSMGQAYPDINASYAYANNNKFGNMFVINNASNIKILTGNSMETTSGAGSAINTMELAGKWVNTSDQITQIDIWADGGSTAYGSGSILKVWGHD